MAYPKIVFFGTPEFAVASLGALIDSGAEVAAVVTAPDKPAGRGHRLLQSAVKTFAVERGIPVLQPEKLKAPEFIEQLRGIGADLFIVIAFRMLPEVVWAMPKLGTFNIHASLLPRYRGAAPINHAIINGEKRTGVTAFFLSHEIDTGDIIGKEEIEILPEDNAGSLHDKLMALGARLTVDTVNAIAAGTVSACPQCELEKETAVCPAPKIFRDNCRIDWRKDTAGIHNLVRGLAPYPAAWTTLVNGNETIDIKILETRPAGSPGSGEHGTVEAGKDCLRVKTGDGVLEIVQLQPQGKRKMNASDYLRGLRLHPNARME